LLLVDVLFDVGSGMVFLGAPCSLFAVVVILVDVLFYVGSGMVLARVES
jgi:hypothetical protein